MGKLSIFVLRAVPVLFGLQVVGIGLVTPIFRAMFADFGSKLPLLTNLLIDGRFGWLVLGIAIAVAPYLILSINKITRPRVSIVTGLGFIQFGLAQGMTLAVFLPIIQLGSVAAGQ